ncbi:DUF6985 domain-containing protein [Pedobacter frigiditerrae]|uniref:DUF6985 domain-containing protein n=1 Tax=Pedobacter frigiditerrae TaxID=2530452 RepID=UPI0010D46E10|nr:hypothetical protein [Pedobacter frigiditerrae]RYE56180.1 MAG: hypothetical protein EOP48_08590 [Sphingobacteriales bacterium]
MESKIVGQIKPVDYDPDFFESAPFPIPYFDNKELKVGFVEPKHEPYLQEADNVLQNFLNLGIHDRNEGSQLVFKYYSETLKHGYTKPLEVNTVTDIWNFVYPTEIIVHWDEHADFYLCVSCGCEWEEEHGLQLVFKDGKKLTRASGHDGGFADE